MGEARRNMTIAIGKSRPQLHTIESARILNRRLLGVRDAGASELTTFVETLTAGLGRPERRTAMSQHITGLLLDGERKSIEPIAARLVDRADQLHWLSRLSSLGAAAMLSYVTTVPGAGRTMSFRFGPVGRRS